MLTFQNKSFGLLPKKCLGTTHTMINSRGHRGRGCRGSRRRNPCKAITRSLAKGLLVRCRAKMKHVSGFALVAWTSVCLVNALNVVRVQHVSGGFARASDGRARVAVHAIRALNWWTRPRLAPRQHGTVCACKNSSVCSVHTMNNNVSHSPNMRAQPTRVWGIGFHMVIYINNVLGV